MFEFMSDFCSRPEPFSRSTIKTLWTQQHLSEQMLRFHLSQDTPLASRTLEDIDRTVQWIHAQVTLSGKRLCDLGCGPGLYAERFQELGAQVTGVDFSARSIRYATERSPRGVRYLEADYLNDALPDGFDIVTLIYTDYCVLGPGQRLALLNKIRRMLRGGGLLIFDVVGLGQFDEMEQVTIVEENLMNGFWCPNNYVGMQRTFVYDDELVTLDRYAIIEPQCRWEIFNWFQYYSPESLTEELLRGGFQVRQLVGDLSGASLEPRSELIGVIAELV